MLKKKVTSDDKIKALDKRLRKANRNRKLSQN